MYGLLVTSFVALLTAGSLGFGVERTQAAAGQYLKLAAFDKGLVFYEGRCFRMDFLIQTDSLNANSVDIDLPYDPAYVQPFSDGECTSPATRIHSTGLFPAMPANIVGADRILVTAYDPSGTDPVNTGPAPADASLGYIYWKVMQPNSAFPLHYNFTYGPYNTLDTNMAENNGNGTDVLDGVENVVFDFRPDTTPPYFTPVIPLDGATGVSVTSPVTFVWTDTGAGIKYNSLQFSMNGVSFTPTLSNCTVTNSNRKPSCNAAVNPGLLQYLTLYTVTATGSDLAVVPNIGTRTWTFVTEDDVHPPYIQNFLPTNGAVGVSPATNIQFNILDYKNNAGVIPGLGVDDTSIVVTVTAGSGPPIQYRKGDPGVTITGTPSNYLVIINPPVDFPENTLVQVAVDAGDRHVPPNVMPTYHSSFRTRDSLGPVITPEAPVDGATEVSADTNVSLRITDEGAGVNINQTTVVIAGVSYNASHPSFSYAGTPNNYVITIDPVANFTGGQQVTVSVSTRDLATPTPNLASASWSFTIASTCATCWVDTEDPGRYATDAPLDDTVSFHVHDTGDGIGIDSIRVRLVGTGAAMLPGVLTHTHPSMTVTGTPADYAVTITLPAAIAANTPYAIVIDASNVNGLRMPTVTYSFMHLDVNPIVPPGECVTAPPPAAEPSGGHRGQMTLPPDPLPSWPQILRRWFGRDGTVTREEVLPDAEARTIDRCYIDGGHDAAPRTHYDDVPPGVWYEESLERLLRRGALDASQQSFRATDSAVRAAFATVLVRLRSTLTPDPAVPPSFDDTEASAWYHPFVEDAARQGWMIGYKDCYGTRPCFTAPLQIATRAEAAAMVVRTYGLRELGLAPAFADVPAFAWYADEVQIAADHCLLQGDDATGLAAPERTVNRAEMAALLDRAERALRYGRDCGAQAVPGSGAWNASLLPVAAVSTGFSGPGVLALLAGLGWLLLRHRKNALQKPKIPISRHEPL